MVVTMHPLICIQHPTGGILSYDAAPENVGGQGRSQDGLGARAGATVV